MKTSEFIGKNIYISGGSSGIGLAVATLFSSLGANIFVFSVDDETMRESAIAEISSAKTNGEQKFMHLYLDVTDKDEVEKVLGKQCISSGKSSGKSFGEPFVLINSAGIGGAIIFEDLSFERFDKIIKLNLYGTRNTIATCLPHMKANGGYIVNVSSMSGLIGLYGYTAYSSSKFAVVGFSHSLRAELKKYNIKVSVFCPVQVDTPLLKKTNKYKPEETKAINNNAGVMTASEAARGLLRGITTNQAVIVPGLKGNLVYLLNRLFPSLREFLTDRIIKKVQGGNG